MNFYISANFDQLPPSSPTRVCLFSITAVTGKLLPLFFFLFSHSLPFHHSFPQPHHFPHPGPPRPLPSLPHFFGRLSTFNWRPHRAPTHQCNKGNHHHHHHYHQHRRQVGGEGGLPLHHHVNGGGPRKYQCKMCPQVGVESTVISILSDVSTLQVPCKHLYNVHYTYLVNTSQLLCGSSMKIHRKYLVSTW